MFQYQQKVALTHKRLYDLILHFKIVFLWIKGSVSSYFCCEILEKNAVKNIFLARVGLGTGIRIRDPYSAKDLDPDPHSTNADPKHCFFVFYSKKLGPF